MEITSAAYLLLFLVGVYPLVLAWRANRRTSLAHAVHWAFAAWTAWGVAMTLGETGRAGFDPLRYVALCLTGCTGVAVLGARRPHVAAWNFVVLGLLAVMLLPLVEELVLGTPSLGGLRIVFLAATLAVGVLNYLPTVIAPAAFLFGIVCGMECVLLFASDIELPAAVIHLVHISWLIAMLLAFGLWRRTPHATFLLTKMWLDFRDRYGLLWGQRVREQYTRSAANAGWPGRLYWQGWLLRENERLPTELEARAMIETMRALLTRFMGEN
jgi:hypothetical protein